MVNNIRHVGLYEIEEFLIFFPFFMGTYPLAQPT